MQLLPVDAMRRRIVYLLVSIPFNHGIVSQTILFLVERQDGLRQCLPSTLWLDIAKMRGFIINNQHDCIFY